MEPNPTATADFKVPINVGAGRNLRVEISSFKGLVPLRFCDVNYCSPGIEGRVAFPEMLQLT